MGERIPGTSPEWDRKLPEGDINSLVDSYGNNYDNGYNFDEKEDDSPSDWDDVAEMADKFEDSEK
jgi:hypothetical protein